MAGPPPQQWGAPPAPNRPGRSNRMALGIIGAVVALALIAGVIWMVRNNNNLAGPQPTSSTGTQPVPTRASDAVATYLRALSAGDAAAALNMSATPPTDSTFLTNAVLAKTTAGKIANISVPEVADQNASTVSASYTLDGTPISTTFPVFWSGGRFWLLNTTASVDISDLWEPWAPVSLAGVATKNSDLTLFPGVYSVASANKNFSYGSTKIVVGDLTEQKAATSKISISAAGKKAVLAAAKEKYSWCLNQKALIPSGCGFYVSVPRGTKVRKDTIRWTTRSGGKVGSAKLKLISNGSIEGTMPATVHFYGRDAKRSGWYWYKDVKLKGFDAKLSGSKITVSFY
ncbi:MAG: hypothetical protein QM619_14550 [Micropruina sp.]|uniref:hypothetical protein n=1 Tax=Micropruina sp. TaxID=2737536 RepID=UPI0039E45D2B